VLRISHAPTLGQLHNSHELKASGSCSRSGQWAADVIFDLGLVQGRRKCPSAGSTRDDNRYFFLNKSKGISKNIFYSCVLIQYAHNSSSDKKRNLLIKQYEQNGLNTLHT
jgi:hypothetical protein